MTALTDKVEMLCLSYDINVLYMMEKCILRVNVNHVHYRLLHISLQRIVSYLQYIHCQDKKDKLFDRY